jgi:hypothetical protein
VGETDATPAGPLTLHSEARGPHWVAWMTAGADARPVRDVVVVGETREEAETRAAAWIEDARTRGYL